MTFLTCRNIRPPQLLQQLRVLIFWKVIEKITLFTWVIFKICSQHAQWAVSLVGMVFLLCRCVTGPALLCLQSHLVVSLLFGIRLPISHYFHSDVSLHIYTSCLIVLHPFDHETIGLQLLFCFTSTPMCKLEFPFEGAAEKHKTTHNWFFLLLWKSYFAGFYYKLHVWLIIHQFIVAFSWKTLFVFLARRRLKKKPLVLSSSKEGGMRHVDSPFNIARKSCSPSSIALFPDCIVPLWFLTSHYTKQWLIHTSDTHTIPSWWAECKIWRSPLQTLDYLKGNLSVLLMYYSSRYMLCQSCIPLWLQSILLMLIFSKPCSLGCQ